MCPGIDELERFAADELDSAAADGVCAHLRGCSACAALLAEVRENLRVAAPVGAVIAAVEAARGPAPLPSKIGSYTIVREIGRGGMGVVYEAQQAFPRRRVALKVIRGGYASSQSLRRFEQEAQLLARLQHPGIAQIYEAGSAPTPDGPRPYLVMEYIEGRPLHRCIEASGIGFRERMELVARICDAVQHAHDRGVIHRDLKPGNILIVEENAGTEQATKRRSHKATKGEEDGYPDVSRPDRVDKTIVAPSLRGFVAQPKVLDFGVARATDADLRATTLQTDIGQLIGTIPYMSPEQVTGDPSQIDRRTDVYSLGVILYELLTGRLPYPLSDRTIPEAVRVIREEEPTPLSSIDRVFRGDVETIVSRALEKDVQRRYPSASAVAADIRRYLNDEPIAARPPSALYQFRKFARRNRALAGGVCAAFFALAAGAAVSTWQAVRARRAEGVAERRLLEAQAAQAAAEASERHARREAAKVAAVNEFLQDMLGAANPETAAGGRAVTVAEVLGRAVARIDDGSLKQDADIEAAVRTTVGNAFRALADYDAAEAQLRKAVQTGRRLAPDGSEDLALSLNKLARVYEAQGRLSDAEPLYREALAMRRRLLGEEHEDVSVILNNLGFLLGRLDRHDEAESMLRDALAMRRRLFGDESSEVATTLNNLAVVLGWAGRNVEAVALLRESLAIDRKLRGEHPNVAATMDNLALMLVDVGHLEEAEGLMTESLDMRRRLLGEEHPSYAVGLNNLAHLKAAVGDDEEAERLYRQSISIDRAALGDRHPRVASTMTNLASIIVRSDRLDEAGRLLTDALDINEAALGPGHSDTLRTMYHLAGLEMIRGRFDEADRLLATAIDRGRKALPAGHWYLGVFLMHRGKCLIELHRAAEARPLLEEARDIFGSTEGTAAAGRADSVDDLLEAIEGADVETVANDRR